MKALALILILPFLFVSCGKGITTKTVSKTEQLNTEALKAAGIFLVSVKSTQGVVTAGVRCEQTTQTNLQKVNSLTAFKDSIGIGNAQTQQYFISGNAIPTYKMEQILLEAITYLKTTDPAATTCLKPIISATTV
ncbi:MAG TPA: hypothetical protein VNJ08_13535 [Bacteriovoracaceae bacterium]|nr:hypothetical protein [Bacteriovoracaceae bacterium]